MERNRTPTVSGGLLILSLLVTGIGDAQPLEWIAQAPGPNTLGQVENIDDYEVVGAVNAIAVHPTDPGIVYAGAVNGGIWRTDNGMDPQPVWQPQTDCQSSLSIGALEFDPTDPTNQTLVAGTGRFSSFGSLGGSRSGLLRTTDGGANWIAMDGAGALSGLNISAVAPRGATIVIAANRADDDLCVGIWRSTDTGGLWRLISGGGTLPPGAVSDLAGDPANPDRLFTAVQGEGVYFSPNAGATWSKVSNAPMDALMADAVNARISVGASNNVYVAIAGADGQLGGVFRSGNGGTTWRAMDIPETVEGGIHPGSQAGKHFSLAADRGDANIVYIGGDSQPEGNSYFPDPNSIGATDYSGRLFRGDASRRSGRQWVHLTHSNRLGASGGGTARGSAPHADSRDMAIAANGVLIEADDGGVYRRTSPRTNTGDWFSMNGNLQATEFHAVAWDAVSDLIIGGAQDTGTAEQRVRSNVRWRSVSTGDGGIVAVDDFSTPGRSIRYSSSQEFSRPRRQIYDAANNFHGEIEPLPLRLLGSSHSLEPLFYTPIKLNTINPRYLIIGAANSVYESLDQGDSINEIGPDVIVTSDGGPDIIAYGATGNAAALYVGSDTQVFVRMTASAALTPSATYAGGTVRGIAIDPRDPETAFVIDESKVFMTADSGGTWADMTGNLTALDPGELHTVAYSTRTPSGTLMVGGNNGVFEAPSTTFSTWSRLGAGLPRAPVLHLEYDATDHILLAGTLGRGAWTLTFPPPPSPPADQPGGASPEMVLPVPMLPPALDHGMPTVPESAGAVELRPGVIINPAQRRVFIMSPAGGIKAVELAEGKELWRSRQAAKPLGVISGQLIGQVEPSGAENALKVVLLSAETGRRRSTQAEGLPAGVQAAVVETASGQFDASVQPAGDDALVHWQFRERPARGVRPDTENMLPGQEGAGLLPEAAEDEADTRSGSFRLDLETGEMSPVTGPGIGDRHHNRASVLAGDERIPALPAAQFLSADGRHVLVGERTEDDRTWEKYQLTIYERETGRRLGAFRSHLSTVPFFVADTRVLYETGPYTRRSETGAIQEEPLKIRMVDLSNGQELWSQEVRDTTYRGPLPP